MFDDLPRVNKHQPQEFPRKFENLSVEDLEKYLIDLGLEINRVQEEILKKRTHLSAADLFFKKL